MGDEIGIKMEIVNKNVIKEVEEMKIVQRRDYGDDVKEKNEIMSFEMKKKKLWKKLRGEGLRRLEEGDLMGIVKEG